MFQLLVACDFFQGFVRRADRVARAEYTTYFEYNVPAQRKAQKQSGRNTRAAEGGTIGAENSTGSSVRSGFAWIDTKSDASNYEVEVVEAGNRRLSLYENHECDLFNRMIRSLVRTVNKRGRYEGWAGSKLDWERHTIVACQGVVEGLVAGTFGARAPVYFTALVLALYHVGPNLLLEFWDLVRTNPHDDEGTDTVMFNGSGLTLGTYADKLEELARKGRKPRTGCGSSPVNTFLGGTPDSLEEAENMLGLENAVSLYSELVKNCRFRLVLCATCYRRVVRNNASIEESPAPKFNVLALGKNVMPVFMRRSWMDKHGLSLQIGVPSEKHRVTPRGHTFKVDDAIVWKDTDGTVLAPHLNDGGHVRIRIDTNEVLVVERGWLLPRGLALEIRSLYKTPREPWPVWASGVMRDSETGCPLVIPQPDSKLMRSVLSFVRCLMDITRVESSSAGHRRNLDGSPRRPGDNPAQFLTIRKHAICMYKTPSDTVGGFSQTEQIRTLYDLACTQSSFLFRHAGPAYSRAQLEQQIIDSSVYRVNKREAMLWREVLRCCHPEFNECGPVPRSSNSTVHEPYLLSGQRGDTLVSPIIDGLPDDDDEDGWATIARACLASATVVCSSEGPDANQDPSTPAPGSLRALEATAGAYCETSEDLLRQDNDTEEFFGLHENGGVTNTSGMVRRDQDAISERTNHDAASRHLIAGMRKSGQDVDDIEHVVLQGKQPVNEWAEKHRLDACIHPYLMVNGGGAPSDCTRRNQYNPKELYKFEHEIMYRGYGRHPTRSFYQADVMNRHEDMKNARYMICRRGIGVIDVSTKDLRTWSENVGRGVKSTGEAKKGIDNMSRVVKAVGRQRHGSQFERQSKKGHFDAMELTFGTANVFWTINPTEGRDPGLSVMLGIVAADGSRHCVQGSVKNGPVRTIEQVIGAVQDPYRVAEWYELMLNAITDTLLVPKGVVQTGPSVGGRRTFQVERGIMGTLVAFAGVNECAQRMGACHAHFKAWLVEMRFVQRASQAHDVTTRDLEACMTMFTDSISSAYLYGHDDDGLRPFEKDVNVEIAVDRADLSFCGTDGFNVANTRIDGVPDLRDVRASVLSGSDEGMGVGGTDGGGEPAFGQEWVKRVSLEARIRARVIINQKFGGPTGCHAGKCDQTTNCSKCVSVARFEERVEPFVSLDPYQTDENIEFEAALSFTGSHAGKVFRMGSQGLGYYLDINGAAGRGEDARVLKRVANDVAKRRRTRINPLYSGASPDRNDVDHTRSSSVRKPDDSRSSGDGDGSHGDETPMKNLRASVCIKHTSSEGEIDLNEFEMDVATIMSRVEIQSMLHGTRHRFAAPPLGKVSGRPVEGPRNKNVRRQCTACCFKTLKAKSSKKCRLRFGENGRAVIEFSYMDDDGVIHLMRNHGHLSPSSKTATIVLKCNNNLELSFYGRDSLAVSLYVTSYLGKSDLTLYEMSLLLVSASRSTDEALSSAEEKTGSASDWSKRSVATAVRMLNAVSGGAQVGGVWNAAVHGGMKLETFSHTQKYIGTRSYIEAVKAIGPVNGDVPEVLSSVGTPLELDGSGNCFVTTPYDDYTNRIHEVVETLNREEFWDQDRATVQLVSPFEWVRYFDARKKFSGKLGPKDFRYKEDYICFEDFVQHRTASSYVVNYRDYLLPGTGHDEEQARWICAIHTPYFTAVELKELYKAGAILCPSRPWAGALRVWKNAHDAAIRTVVTRDPCAESMVSRDVGYAVVKIENGTGGYIENAGIVSVHVRHGMVWASAGNGWSRMLRGLDLENLFFTRPSRGKDAAVGVLLDRFGWRNRYVIFALEMFEGSDCASRMKVKEQIADAQATLEKMRVFAETPCGDFGETKLSDGLPFGVTVADRDALELLILQNVPDVEECGTAGGQLVERLRVYRDEAQLAAADTIEQQAQVRELASGDCVGGQTPNLKEVLGILAGPFSDMSVTKNIMMRARRGLLPESSDLAGLEDDTSCSITDLPSTAKTLRAGATADLSGYQGCVPTQDNGMDPTQIMTFREAVVLFRLNALQFLQFALMVAAYEAEIVSSRSVTRNVNSSWKQAPVAKWYDSRLEEWRDEASKHELKGVYEYMVEQYKSGKEREFQIGMFVTGSGGTGKSYVVRAFRAYLESRGHGKMLLVACPTGRAAVSIQGETSWSAMGYGTDGPGASGSTSPAFLLRRARWLEQNVTFLVIDEIGMLGAADLADIDTMASRLRADQESFFGGLHLIGSGDLCQKVIHFVV